MEIRVLKYFLAVAREGNFTAAANSLYITQPTLSRQIMDLERELGKSLFTRTKRGVALTEDGVLLQRYAENIIAMMEKAESELMDVSASLKGDIIIGGAEVEDVRFLMKELSKFKEENPQVRLHFLSENRSAVLDKLDQGLLDFGIVLGEPEIPRFSSLPLPSKTHWGLLVPASHPLAGQASVTAQELLTLPLITPMRIEEKLSFRDWIGTIGAESLHITGEYLLFYYARMMVEEGLGCALCIEGLLPPGDKEKLVFLPLDPPLPCDTFLIWRRHIRMGRTPAAFLEQLKQAMEADASSRK